MLVERQTIFQSHLSPHRRGAALRLSHSIRFGTKTKETVRCSVPIQDRPSTTNTRPTGTAQRSSSFYDRRREPLNPDGTLNKIKFTFADKSYYLAPKPLPDTDQ